MPDDFDSISERLHHFDPGASVKPPTPTEIRRRGDRMRRRNTALAAVGAVVAVAVIATPVAVFGGGSSHDKRGVGPATDPPSSTPTPNKSAGIGPLEDADLVTVEDLPVLPEGFEPWTEPTTTTRGDILTCQAITTEAVGSTESIFREYTSYITPGEANVSGDTRPTRWVRTAVWRFEDSPAGESYDEARNWVEECPHSTRTNEPVFPTGSVHELSVDGATGVFRGWGYGAVEFCPEACDAGWYTQQGVALLGDRLVLIELVELAGPGRPTGQTAEMEQLFTAAVDRAAGLR